ALALTGTVDGVDRVDLDGENLLHGQLDLGLVGAGVDQEGVLAFVDQAVALFRDDRCKHYVARILDGNGAHLPSSLMVWAASPPAGTKPAALASSTVANQTSASVASYQREPGTWYFMESLLPLMEPSAPAAAVSATTTSSTTRRLEAKASAV